MSRAVTPMLQQYLAIKRDYADCLLFFRLGDFYEMFFEDAVTASREMEIVLTGRESGAERVPMCGVPYHAVSGYLAKLLQKGYKVAICEQVEDPQTAKGLVKREVVRVVTPGTVLEPQLLKDKANNYLAALNLTGANWGLAYVDLSTGEFKTTILPEAERPLLVAELNRIKPAELYLGEADYQRLAITDWPSETSITLGEPSHFQISAAADTLKGHFQTNNLTGFGCADQPAAIIAAGAVLRYLNDTQKNTLAHINRLITYQSGDYLVLDPVTRRNLELTKTMRSGEISGSLLGVIDQTVSAMGGRLLRSWLEQPLARRAAIIERQEAVTNLTRSLELRQTLQESFRKIYDLQRILGKLATGAANARDLLGLKNSLQAIPEIQTALAPTSAGRLQELTRNLAPLAPLTELLEAALRSDPPLTIRDGGMIKPEFQAELTELHAITTTGKRWLVDLEQQERERTGIKSLKIGYNQVWGYYIEVSKANLNAVPADYLRKQTLANGERFINQALKDYENRILGAQQKSVALEYQIFLELRQAVLGAVDQLQLNAAVLAELDALVSLAEVAVRNNYVCPVLTDQGRILLLDSRHPVVEQTLPSGSFVPNDLLLEPEQQRTLIITGPNMAGKSTYMRQAALIVLMAHCGSFVPAKQAEIALVDRIFTRVGAADDLAGGQSTFMVEMNEVAYILNHATARSLVILDELGRGTSTFDGLSIAWAVLEFINNPQRIGCKTMIATHYHELTELELHLSGVKNCHSAVGQEGERITFLHKILPGRASQSYGIEVARLAGLPSELTARAKEVLQTLETTEASELIALEQHPVAPSQQLQLFPLAVELVMAELKSLDLTATTPLEALNAVYNWQQKLRAKAEESDLRCPKN